MSKEEFIEIYNEFIRKISKCYDRIERDQKKVIFKITNIMWDYEHKENENG